MRIAPLVLLTAAALAGYPAWPAGVLAREEGPTANSDPIEVKASKQDEHVVIDVRMSVPTSPRIVWDVLTDYDHMPSFLDGLEESRVVQRNGNHLEVMQKGKESYGPFSFGFENLRAVELSPRAKIVSHLLKGNLRQSDAATELIDRGGSRTEVVYHGDFIPETGLPPLVGIAAVESGTRKQFEELRAEMEKRSDLRGATEKPGELRGATEKRGDLRRATEKGSDERGGTEKPGDVRGANEQSGEALVAVAALHWRAKPLRIIRASGVVGAALLS